MLDRNPHFEELEASYLFPKIRQKAQEFAASNPKLPLLSFGIGDVTLPLVPAVIQAMQNACKEMAEPETFKGYGPEMGYENLRAKIRDVVYHDKLDLEEIFISDGAKCDIARLFTWASPHATVALQTPCYPAFADAWKIIHGKHNLRFLSCDSLTATPKKVLQLPADIIVIVNPNNPTGHLIPLDELKHLIAQAAHEGRIIIYDSAYRSFIQDPSYPSNIYDLPFARESVIEIGSFSKWAGFTGVRLGWTCLPKTLVYRSNNLSMRQDYTRLIQTLFNGASYISQSAGLAALSPEGQMQIQEQSLEYLRRAALLRKALKEKEWLVSGAEHSPFVWTCPPKPGLSSWELFDHLLQTFGWVTTPGSGFGELGEGFVRLSGFAKPDQIELGIKRLQASGHALDLWG